MRDKLSKMKDMVGFVANELEELSDKSELNSNSVYNLTSKLDSVYDSIEEVESFLDDLICKL